MKKLSVLLFVSVLLISLQLKSQTENQSNAKGEIKWMDFETAIEKQKEAPRIIFIDMYTDWCGWCKKLDKETFSHPKIAQYINNSFYPVKFDAEGNDTVQYKGKTYVNKGGGKRSTHELAALLMNNQASYPSMVFLDPQGQPSKVPGFMTVEQIEPILAYFAEGINKTSPFDKYKAAFNFLFNSKDNPDIDAGGVVKWMSLNKAVAAQNKDPKKILIFFHSKTYQKISSELMLKVTLANPYIAKYINNNFYPVLFDAARTDTIRMFDQTMINEQKSPGYPHQFAFVMMQNNVKFPSISFLNEEKKLIPPIQGYFPDMMVEPYLHFIKTGAFRNQKWQAYYESFTGMIKREKTGSAAAGQN